MEISQINVDRFDRLANEAINHVFDFMVQEKATLVRDSHIVGEAASGKDMFSRIKELVEGYFTISVGFVGDCDGKVNIQLSRAMAEKFAIKLLDVPSIDWIGEDPNESLLDVMGELGNMLVGLIKGGLTKDFPDLMLTPPKVLQNRRIKLGDSRLLFRKQYAFSVMKSAVLVDICCE